MSDPHMPGGLDDEINGDDYDGTKMNVAYAVGSSHPAGAVAIAKSFIVGHETCEVCMVEFDFYEFLESSVKDDKEKKSAVLAFLWDLDHYSFAMYMWERYNPGVTKTFDDYLIDQPYHDAPNRREIHIELMREWGSIMRELEGEPPLPSKEGLAKFRENAGQPPEPPLPTSYPPLPSREYLSSWLVNQGYPPLPID